MSSNEKEEFYRKVMWKTIKEMVKAYLSTREMSQKYLMRDDKREIDQKVDELSQKVTNAFIMKLKEKGYLENKEPSQEEFGKLLKDSIKESISEPNENNTK